MEKTAFAPSKNMVKALREFENSQWDRVTSFMDLESPDTGLSHPFFSLIFQHNISLKHPEVQSHLPKPEEHLSVCVFAYGLARCLNQRWQTIPENQLLHTLQELEDLGLHEIWHGALILRQTVTKDYPQHFVWLADPIAQPQVSKKIHEDFFKLQEFLSKTNDDFRWITNDSLGVSFLPTYMNCFKPNNETEFKQMIQSQEKLLDTYPEQMEKALAFFTLNEALLKRGNGDTSAYSIFEFEKFGHTFEKAFENCPKMQYVFFSTAAYFLKKSEGFPTQIHLNCDSFITSPYVQKYLENQCGIAENRSGHIGQEWLDRLYLKSQSLPPRKKHNPAL